MKEKLNKLLAGIQQKAGDIVGKGGSTGRSTGSHLHYEMRYKGLAFDPEKVYDFEGDMSGGWNGYYKGVLAQVDVYIYYVEVVYGDGQKIAKEGSITIVK